MLATEIPPEDPAVPKNAAALLVCSSKFCIGEILDPVEQDGKIVAARMVVYDGEDDAYITFITQSAYCELADWMKYREEAGENITGDSWVMRDLRDTQVKISRGLVTIQKKLNIYRS